MNIPNPLNRTKPLSYEAWRSAAECEWRAAVEELDVAMAGAVEALRKARQVETRLSNEGVNHGWRGLSFYLPPTVCSALLAAHPNPSPWDRWRADALAQGWLTAPPTEAEAKA